MNKICCFIGHRKINAKLLETRLLCEVEKLINIGFNNFKMGCHGEFDSLSLKICKQLRDKYKNIEIEVILTSHSMLNNKYNGLSFVDMFYSDVKTNLYDIGNTFYKNIIIKSNQCMVDESCCVICYVNPNKINSGAKKIVEYAKKTNKSVINLYKETDNPLYGKTQEEIEKERNAFFKNK